MLDAVACRAARGVLGRAVAVPHPTLVEDVRERVPLCSALGAHDDHVVGEAEPTDGPERRQRLVLSPGEVVRAGRGGDQLGVGPQPAVLWSALVVGQGQGDDLAVADQRGGGADLFGAHEVQCAELVVLTPAAPAAEPVM